MSFGVIAIHFIELLYGRYTKAVPFVLERVTGIEPA